VIVVHIAIGELYFQGALLPANGLNVS